MTDEEVQKLAEAEGLALVPAVGTSTGYKGVTHSGGSTRPFKAQTRVEGTKKNLGCFATAAEALRHEWFREAPLPKDAGLMPTFPDALCIACCFKMQCECHEDGGN